MHNKLMGAMFALIAFLIVGCGLQASSTDTGTATPFIITATLPPTITPRPTETLLPPPQPTVAHGEGVTSTQLNVRAKPSTASKVLGVIPPNTHVEIIGTDPSGNWWQINFPNGVNRQGWVTAQYITTTDKPVVPVVGGDTSNPNLGGNAVVIQQLNIRSGPGTDFNSLGLIKANDVVALTGKDDTGTWLQIEFPDGPDGKGWVNAGFVKADGVENLPIIAESGEIVGTGTPMNTPLPPTPTLVPAPADNDSYQSPVKTVIFDRAGTHTLIYNGGVSAPTGDPEDWIAIVPYDDVVYFKIDCTGSDAVTVEIVGSGSNLACNEALKAVPVQSGETFIVHIRATPTSGVLQYTNYILTIKASP